MNKVKDTVKEAKKKLKNKPDEKLIKGYKEAMRDYEKTENVQILRAAEFIKKEIDRRGLKLEE